VWAPIGSRPLALVHPQYSWLYVYAFVRPQTGESVFWLMPKVDAELLSAVLKDFANERSLGEKRWALVVLDQAGWHSSEDLEIPKGVLPFFLPSHSPELQLAERLWPLVDAAVANGQVQDEPDLWKRLEEQCTYLRSQPELLQGYTCFHWWPATLT
jgi:hypothetical protein